MTKILNLAYWATVKSVSPMTIRPDNSAVTINAKHLATYSPAVNDRVAYVVLGRTVLVLGKPI